MNPHPAFPLHLRPGTSARRSARALAVLLAALLVAALTMDAPPTSGSAVPGSEPSAPTVGTVVNGPVSSTASCTDGGCGR